MAAEFLITGGQGFFGAWIARRLLAEGAPFVMTDLRPDDSILGQVLGAGKAGELDLRFGDISDPAFVEGLVAEVCPRRIIHLAGLQVPTCRKDPVLGARVNILGTLNIFEAARRHTGGVGCVVYASSAAVAGPQEDYSMEIPDGAAHVPRTHYGVFKLCNEGNARVYFQDHGVSSVGLRPGTVYGVGRDFGLTSDPTKAVKAALVGRPFTIRFGGDNAFQYAPDVAATFVLSALENRPAALTFNMRGQVVAIAQFVAELEDLLPSARGLIQFGGDPIPVAVDYDDSELRAFLPSMPNTSLRQGIEETLNGFRRLQQAGTLDLSDLEQ